MPKKNLCAVIVTYNRKELLERCLKAILSQTLPLDEILVVNNASSDGTVEMLSLEFPQVKCLDLKENLGGAGGFHCGLKWAYDQGFQWIAAMDDDGQPKSDCFQRLLEYDDAELLIRAPLVLSEADHETLAFKIQSKNSMIASYKQAINVSENELIVDCINPFNGLIISRKVVDYIGLPKKELFLWGDEYEYFLRMKQARIKLATIVTAHFYHPPDRMLPDAVSLLGREFPVYYANNPLKDYLILRNHAYIIKKYRGWLGWGVHILRYLLFYYRQSKVKDMPKIFSASIHAARSDFSHHRKFL